MNARRTAQGQRFLDFLKSNPVAYTKFLKAKDEGKIFFVFKKKGERVHTVVLGASQIKRKEEDFRPEEKEEIDCDE